ncbi:exodeoxyribonuclease III [Georgenia sp. Z1344]|uniref:exodeoxyribonuclease III n=1 Tax=Georgenia sp. Z1344 TaxID=3416706 RepID=UPI003CEA33E3
MKIATVNVNGVRAAYRKGMGEWLAEAAPEVALLQEVRADEATLSGLLGDGWTVVQQASDLKGRAGVAIATTLDVTAVRIGLGTEKEAPVDTGRWVEADVVVPGLDVPLTLVSAYIHSGTVTDQQKMDNKYAHLRRTTARLSELTEQHAAGEREVLLAGDLNIVRTEQDIKNWKGNHNKTSGVLDDEIAFVDTWIDELGLVDVHRQLSGDVQGPYTWWSNRGKAFDNDAGWRIDYQLVTPGFAGRAQESQVDRAPSWDTRWSDHAPLVVTYA